MLRGDYLLFIQISRFNDFMIFMKLSVRQSAVVSRTDNFTKNCRKEQQKISSLITKTNWKRKEKQREEKRRKK